MLCKYFSILIGILLFSSYANQHPLADGEGVFFKNHKIDVDQILKSQRLFMNYANCFLDKQPCTPEGKTLKEQIPNAMKTECAKCTEEEKKQIGKIMSYTLQNHRNIWNEIMDKYDIDGSFRKKYEVNDENDD